MLFYNSYNKDNIKFRTWYYIGTTFSRLINFDVGHQNTELSENK